MKELRTPWASGAVPGLLKPSSDIKKIIPIKKGASMITSYMSKRSFKH